ncbi:MAG: hypothetical protein JWP52_4406 [Rhizobacter sp.]|nr:hypothetical protein [Rhizobacter sp.]
MKVVVCDADSLFGHTTRALLLHLAHEGVVRLQWSRLILEESTRALRKMGRFATREARLAHLAAIETALPQALVPVIEVQRHWSAVWRATDTSDQHVAACAVAVRALGRVEADSPVFIATKNTRDFKAKKLLALGIVPQKPDTVLLDLLHTHPEAFAAAFRKYRLARKTPQEVLPLIERLRVDLNRGTSAALLAHHEAGTLLL